MKKTGVLGTAAAALTLLSITCGILIGKNTHSYSLGVSTFSKSESNTQQFSPSLTESSSTSSSKGKININTADVSELMQIPSVGSVIAQRIIDYRSENGIFYSLNELLLIEGIGESKLSKIKDYVTVGG